MYQALNVTVVPGRAGIDFGLLIGTEVQHFRLSFEALRDRFGANESETDAELMDCFLRNEGEICAKAFANSPARPNDDVIVLSSRDF